MEDHNNKHVNTEKTGIYGNQQDFNKTGVYTHKEVNKHSSQQGVEVGNILTFSNRNYTVKKIISLGTGEANVFQIEDEQKKQYALKLYFEFKDEAEEPNGLALERIQKLDDPDILRLLEFGIGKDKFKGKYCYEISDFALGGNILDVNDFHKKYTAKFVEEQIIPQIFLAITKLHEYKIYHCDIKPGNILFKDREQTDIILGDYGSAKAYDLESEKSLRKSTTIKGTEFYLAPEQARGIVSEKNDYYSIGMVLLHLLYPESFTNDKQCRQIDRYRFEQIIERQYNLKPIIDFNPQLGRLNNLIEGLTLINHINRWGADEFSRWLKGENVEVSYRTKEASGIKPLKTGPIEIASSIELIEYIESKSTWFEDLFEDPDVYKLMKGWLDTYIGIPDRKRFDKLVGIYKFEGRTMLKAAITMFLLPERSIRIEGEEFNLVKADNLNAEVTRYVKKIDSVYKAATIEDLILYFFQIEYSLLAMHYADSENRAIRGLIFKLYNLTSGKLKLPEQFDYKTLTPKHIKSKKKQYDYNYILQIFYAFNEERPFPNNEQKPINSLEELCLFYLKKPELFDDKYHKLERNALLVVLKENNFVNKKLKELVNHTFYKHTDIQLNVNHISFEKVCNIHYSLEFVLDSYLKDKGISEPVLISEKKGLMYVAKNKLFGSSVANGFINHVYSNHGGKKKWVGKFATVKKQIKKEHRKQRLVNSIISMFTTVAILAVLVAIVLRLFDVDVQSLFSNL